MIIANEIFDLKYENFLLRVIRRNHYLDLGNGSNKFGNHCYKSTVVLITLKKRKQLPHEAHFANYGNKLKIQIGLTSIYV